MTEQDKQLLLKDLCVRLPYNVFVYIEPTKWCKAFNLDDNYDGTENIHTLTTCTSTGECNIDNGYLTSVEDVKPYLRLPVSMTEEETKKYHNLCNVDDNDWEIFSDTWESFDYLNSIHIDYRGLIKKGLALEAPEGMYK